ncbi:MAG: TIGR03067 domain-containing protein [Gemmataceae bacterium]
MNRYMLGGVCGAVAATVVADEPKTDVKKVAVEKALGAFTGCCEIVAVTPDGATKDSHRLVFNRDGTYAALDKDGKELWAGTFWVDPTVSPKVWDHRSHDATKTGTDVLGIYELDGDKLKVVCVVGHWKENEWTGKPRPTVTDPKKADVTIELKRVK